MGRRLLLAWLLAKQELPEEAIKILSLVCSKLAIGSPHPIMAYPWVAPKWRNKITRPDPRPQPASGVSTQQAVEVRQCPQDEDGRFLGLILAQDEDARLLGLILAQYGDARLLGLILGPSLLVVFAPCRLQILMQCPQACQWLPEPIELQMNMEKQDQNFCIYNRNIYFDIKSTV